MVALRQRECLKVDMNQNEVSAAAELFRTISPTGKCDVVLAFEVLLYFDGGASKHWPGIRRFFELSRDLIRKDVNYYAIDGRSKFRRVEDETFTMLESWADGSTAERTLYGMTLHGGQHPDDASETGFDLYADGGDPGYVRLVMPAEFALSSSSLATSLSLAHGLDFLSGTAGFAVSMRANYSAQKVGGAVYALSRRFKGVDFGRPHMFASFVAQGLKSVNWLTFLGAEGVARSGGAAKIGAIASTASLKIHDLPSGIAIQAGALPTLGDVNRQESLDNYKAANRLVLPSRFPVESLNGYDEIGGEENTVDWISRFDE